MGMFLCCSNLSDIVPVSTTPVECPNPSRPLEGFVVGSTTPPNTTTFAPGVAVSLDCASGFSGSPFPEAAICGSTGKWINGVGDEVALEAAVGCTAGGQSQLAGIL